MSEPSVVAATSIALPEIEPDVLRQIRRLRDIAPLAAPLSRSWRRCLDEHSLLPEAPPEALVHDALHVRERQQLWARCCASPRWKWKTSTSRSPAAVMR